MQLYSIRSRQMLALGQQIAQGGEGSIFLLPSEPGKVAKRYLTTPSEHKVEKLQAMSAAATEQLMRVAAWPTDLLVARVTDEPSKAIAFVMPKAASPEQLHELYTPKSRAHSFPDADLRFVLHVAANVVRAFGTVHSAGHVIGDVNHGHLLVGSDGRVTLIDCDSFQIAAGSRVFTCDVGVPLFTAPELHGRGFKGLMRTANHDRFGMAVLLFHLLFMGRHPYAGIPLNPSQSTEIEASIRAGRFAYSARNRAFSVDQPPGTIPLQTYGPTVARLFEAAFAHPPNDVRPDEKAWVDGLVALQSALKPCPASSSHQFPGHLTACPWCAIEGRTGVRLFGVKMLGTSASGELELAALWRAIEAVPRPQPVGDPAVMSLKPPARTSAERKRKTTRTARKITAPIAAMIALTSLAVGVEPLAGIFIAGLLAFVIWPRTRDSVKTAAVAAVAAAEREYKSLSEEWRRSATEITFVNYKNRLNEAKSSLDRFPKDRAVRVSALTSEVKQRENFLDQFRVDRAGIPGIGPGRAATLASFGIETAWDTSRSKILAVPGFGPSLANNIMTWRTTHESRFRYNPRQAPNPADVRAIDVELAGKRSALIALLQRGPVELRQANDEAARSRQRLQPLIEQRYVLLQIAKRALADL